VGSWQGKPSLKSKTEKFFFNKKWSKSKSKSKSNLNLIIQILFFPIKKNPLITAFKSESEQIPMLIIDDIFPITFSTPVIPVLKGIQDCAVNVQLATFFLCCLSENSFCKRA